MVVTPPLLRYGDYTMYQALMQYYHMVVTPVTKVW